MMLVSRQWCLEFLKKISFVIIVFCLNFSYVSFRTFFPEKF